VKIGVRKSPHIETLVAAIAASGEEIVSTYDTGCDFWLCWGWPQAEQVARDNGGITDRIICIDAHPFALAPGARTGDRIFQLGNWGFLAKYPPITELPEAGATRKRSHNFRNGGPVLVLGHVSSTEQLRGELVDVWYTPGGDAWLAEELRQPNRKFRPHPRMWTEPRPQPSLAEDLKGCSRAVAWNSTAVIHARQLGVPATTVEAHGWGQFELEELEALRVSPSDVRSGVYWRAIYRPWLETIRRAPSVQDDFKELARETGSATR
jgi:hypothetical protein